MNQPDWTTERAELERVAQEYRARGYQVVVSPSGPDLPEFLRDYPPDIVASNDRESVLVEVKDRYSTANLARLRTIAQRIENQPGWRLAVVSPSLHGGPTEEFRPADMQRIRQLLSEASALQENGHQRAAILLYWAAFEAAMRLAADRYAVEVPRPDTWSLMRELVSNGVLDRDRYQSLNDSFRLRSAFAHGLEPIAEVDLERVSATLRDSTLALLTESEQAGSEMPS
jgi:uncharacterized protein YutE (UPF0331/DUF86 family)